MENIMTDAVNEYLTSLFDPATEGQDGAPFV